MSPCTGEETGTAGRRRRRNSGQVTHRPHCQLPSQGRAGAASAPPSYRLAPDQLCNQRWASTLLRGSVAPLPPAPSFRLASPRDSCLSTAPSRPGPLLEQCDPGPVGCMEAITLVHSVRPAGLRGKPAPPWQRFTWPVPGVHDLGHPEALHAGSCEQHLQRLSLSKETAHNTGSTNTHTNECMSG